MSHRRGASGPPGLVSTLQEATACARGQLLARIDADDIAEPRRLAPAVRAARSNARPGRLRHRPPDAFRRCKVHYLKLSALHGRTVVVWGAGPVGKSFARELLKQEVSVRAFLDLDPRKVGQTIYNLPVWPASPGTIPEEVYVLAAVGSPVARAQISAALQTAGRLAWRDFCAVA